MKLNGQYLRILSYDLERYPFPSTVEEMLGGTCLECVHEWLPRDLDATGDQDTPPHRRFYEQYARLRDLYVNFVRDQIAPHYDEDLCLQRIPTFRIHYPGMTAVREFHRDSDYRHQAGIVNYWLPLTRAFDTNSIWVETEPGSERYQPVELVPGQILCFDAVALKHGNHTNETPFARVSFDFRVLPYRSYRDTGRVSVTNGTRLSLGDYYLLLTRDGQVRNEAAAAPQPGSDPGDGS